MIHINPKITQLTIKLRLKLLVEIKQIKSDRQPNMEDLYIKNLVMTDMFLKNNKLSIQLNKKENSLKNRYNSNKKAIIIMIIQQDLIMALKDLRLTLKAIIINHHNLRSHKIVINKNMNLTSLKRITSLKIINKFHILTLTLTLVIPHLKYKNLK